MEMKESVWVFNGPRNTFPAAVFSSFEKALAWIKEIKASGTLSQYPVDTSVYQWCVDEGYFEAKKSSQKSSSFICNFSSAYQKHYHFDNGESNQLD